MVYYYALFTHLWLPVSVPGYGEGEDKFGDRTGEACHSGEEPVWRSFPDRRGGGTEGGGVCCIRGVATEPQGEEKGQSSDIIIDKQIVLSLIGGPFLHVHVCIL